jgi:3'-phosphoadenosine 5'-phosphosulfate sulfotransferase (PAPS reductase)/FAD synthetase
LPTTPSLANPLDLCPVGFSGDKDSTLVAHLIFEAAKSIPAAQRTKEIHVVCTDIRVEIPAVVETIEGTLNKLQRASDDAGLRVQTHQLRPPADQSFWVNFIGRGYPPPNRFFRWCTQRMKIDPVNTFVERRLGRDGEAILHLGARRAESATRAQTMAGHEVRNGLRKHPNLLLALQQQTGLRLLTDDELLPIQQHWKGARDPDDGRGVARLVNEQRGQPMNDLRETARLHRLEAEVAEEKALSPQTLQRLVANVEEYSESHRAHGLQAELVRILQDDMRVQRAACFAG